MRMNRRAALAGGVAAATVGPGVLRAQTPVRLRQGVDALTATSDDVAAFGEAVRLMKRRNDRLSWANQTRIHHRQAQHNNSLFLPWHRQQLLHLEQIVARLTGHERFAMPYWDWQEHRYLPDWVTDRDSPLYERDRERGVETLDFAAARWAESPYTARLAADDFATFCGRQPRGMGMVEGYGHNHIHQLIGGAMKHPRTSAQDPMFWLHHSNVDRVWATWHGARGKDLYPPEWTAMTVSGFVDPDGREVGALPVGGTLETRPLGYDYDRLYPFPVFSVPQPGPPGATRRIPTGGRSWTMRAEAAGGGRMSLTLPDEAVARMRDADDTLVIAGEGAVAYASEAGLEDRSLEVRMTAGGRERSLGSSPTFVHLPDPGEGHRGHGGPYVLPFRFGEEVLNLLAAGDGPAAVTVFAEDLAPELGRPDARAAWMELTLTLTETRWT